MSKYELRDKTASLSGVTYEQSLLATTALTPPLLTRIGLAGLHELVTLFYDRVFDDKVILGIFASSTKSEAIDNQYRFLVQTFGGEALYKEKKGEFTRLVGRHANYHITSEAAERWLVHMNGAIDDHEELKKQNDEAKEYLKKYFRYTAFYIVAARVYMKDDQLSGGVQIDSGRVW